MTTRLTIDRAGRIVIPKPLREELALNAGDTLELESSGESITLRPARAAIPLAKEKGVWVLRTGEPLPVFATDNLLEVLRAERDEHILGVKR